MIVWVLGTCDIFTFLFSVTIIVRVSNFVRMWRSWFFFTISFWSSVKCIKIICIYFYYLVWILWYYERTKVQIRKILSTFDGAMKIAWNLSTFCRLELMFERAEQWSQDLEDNYEQLDKWKRKGDSLLYSMLPRSVADQLQNEQSTMNTCKANIMFTYYTPRF